MVLHFFTYLEAWGSRRSATPLPRPAACDNLLAPNLAQMDLSSFPSYQAGVVAYEGDFMDHTEMYRQAFCVCEALMAPSIALRF